MKFKVGDVVRIRDWDDMERQYGLTMSGAIDCLFTFPERMRRLCGKEFVIIGIGYDGVVLGLKSNYLISTDMLVLVDDGESYESSEELNLFLDEYGVRK